MKLDRFTFTREFVHLRKRPISFDGRPYLPRVYQSEASRLVIRASRQVEKSTFLVNSILYLAIRFPGIHIVCVFPRQEQAHVSSSSRLLGMIDGSPVIRRVLLGKKSRKPQVMNLRFANGSEVYVRAAYHTADAVRGLDADVLIVDEFQDIAAGGLPVIEETLSHSQISKLILTGTPKSIDNHLEGVYSRSTAYEWQVPCQSCQFGVILDQACIGPASLMCPKCQQPIDPRQGLWLPRNPQSAWGDGFWINHLMVPWISHEQLPTRQRAYDPAAFRNECLGLPTTLGDHIVTREEVEACCTERPMAASLADISAHMRTRLLAGVDRGGGAVSRTVLVIGYITDNGQLEVRTTIALPVQEDPDRVVQKVADLCERFQVRAVAADGAGNGTVYNTLLLGRLPRLPRLFGMQYAATDHAPKGYKSRYLSWIIARSPSIGAIFHRIKM
jgi:Phage terminase large subunit (GpA)